MKKLSEADIASQWTVEREQTGVPELVGTRIRIEIQQMNPMVRRAVIVPTTGSPRDAKYQGLFDKIKPAVAGVEGNLLLCSLGILARRVK